MPLIITSDYFQTTLSSTPTLTDQETGSISVSALLHQNPKYWILSSGGKTDVDGGSKKTLVLNDWSAFTWSPNKHYAVEKALCELLDNGFVLIIARERFKLSDYISINTKPILPSVTVDPGPLMMKRTLSVALNQYSLSSSFIHNEALQTNNTFFILDYFEINRLLRGEPTTRRVIYTGDLYNTYPKTRKMLDHLYKLRPEGLDAPLDLSRDNNLAHLSQTTELQSILSLPIMSCVPFGVDTSKYEEDFIIFDEDDVDNDALSTLNRINNTPGLETTSLLLDHKALLLVKSTFLQSITISFVDCSIVSTQDIETLLENNPNLHSLFLSAPFFQGQFSDAALARIARMRHFSLRWFNEANIKRSPTDRLLSMWSSFASSPGLLNTKIWIEQLHQLGCEVGSHTICSKIWLGFEQPQIYSFSQAHLKNLHEPDFNSFADSMNDTIDSSIHAARRLDADTRAAQTPPSFEYDRVFFSRTGPHPSPTDYRQSVFDTLDITSTPCSASNAFALFPCARTFQSRKPKPTRVSDDCFKALFDMPKRSDCEYYYAKQTITIGKQDVSLVSLHAAEEIVSYHLSQEVNVQLRDDTGPNLYFMRLDSDEAIQSMTLDIDYLVKIPIEQPALPSHIQAIINKYQRYRTGALDMIAHPNPTGSDFLRAIQQQQKGACRHRMVACYNELTTSYPDLNVLMITNNGHAFVEIEYHGQWYKCDLGGYPGTLSINNKHMPAYTIMHYLSSFFSMLKDALMVMLGPIIVGVAWLIKQCLSPFTSHSLEPSIPAQPTFPISNEVLDPEAKLADWCEALFKLPPPTAETLDQYLMQLCFGKDPDEYHNHLAEVSSNEALHALLLRIYQYACNNHVSIFMIQTPTDLVCAADYISKEGIKKEGPGGPLYDFIQQAAEHPLKPALLLVNYGAFMDSDFPALNRLLDATGRYVDETPLPPHMRVVGVINPHTQGAYQSNDFYSRFKRNISYCRFDTATLNEGIPGIPIPIDNKGNIANAYPLRMFNVPDQISRVFGRYCLQGDHLEFKPGLLNESSTPNASYCFENADFGDDEFSLRWRLHKLNIKNTALDYQTTGYDWDALTRQISSSNVLNAPTFILNPTRISLFFETTLVDNETETAKTGPGILEQHTNKTLNIRLTRQITEDAWALFLESCCAFGVTIHVSALAGIDLPGLEQAPRFDLLLPDEQASSLTNPIVIDAADLEGPDLLGKKTGKYVHHKFVFHQAPAYLEDQLNNGADIMLYGPLSDKLQDALAPLFFERAHNSNKSGTLTCIQPHNITFPYERPLPEIQPSPLPTTREAIEAESNAYIAARREELRQLAKTRCGLLLGHSGVGKSSFVRQYWKEEGPFFQGCDQIKAWLSCQEPGIKTLFIDEINTVGLKLALFEGLKRNKPGVYFDGDYYNNLENHFLLGAANQCNEGGERIALSLFNTPEQVLVFDRLPSSFIYWEVLQPLAEPPVCQAMIDHYNAQLSRSKDTVLISPRELVTMTLCIQHTAKQHPNVPIMDVVHWTLAQCSTAEENTQATPFFKPIPPTPKASSVVWTPSRLPLQQSLDAFLSTRAYPAGNNGLSMFILQGLSGIGKSVLVEDYLQRALGFKLLPLGEIAHEPSERVYWKIPAGLCIEKRRLYIQQAYDLGYVLIIDELNSIALGEGFVNSLYNKPPMHHHGFRIIGTQNPPSFSGRRLTTTPEARRTWLYDLPAYPIDELVTVIRHQEPQLSEHAAYALAKGFTQAIANAKHATDATAPTLRDCLDKIDVVLKHVATLTIRQSRFAQFFKANINERRNREQTSSSLAI